MSQSASHMEETSFSIRIWIVILSQSWNFVPFVFVETTVAPSYDTKSMESEGIIYVTRSLSKIC